MVRYSKIEPPCQGSTTLTTLVGLMPLALGIAVGSEVNAALAGTVIGGPAVPLSLTPQGESA